MAGERADEGRRGDRRGRTRRRARTAAALAVGAVALLAACTPEGVLDASSWAVTTEGRVARVQGWARDPETHEPIDVRVEVDGRVVGTYRADGPRPDVQAALAAGPRHGFDVVVPIGPGSNRVCVRAVNVGEPGEDPVIGCHDVVAWVGTFGSADVVERVPGGVRVAGWVIDSATDAPAPLTVTVDGAVVADLVADGHRPDVRAAFPQWGARHGFDATVPGVAGGEVCVRSGGARLGCRHLDHTAVRVIGDSLIASTVAEQRQALSAFGFDAAVSGLPGVALTSPVVQGWVDGAVGSPVVVLAAGSNDVVAVAQRADVVGAEVALAEHRAAVRSVQQRLAGSCLVWVGAREQASSWYRTEHAPQVNAVVRDEAEAAGHRFVDWSALSAGRSTEWFTEDGLHFNRWFVDERGELQQDDSVRRQAGADAYAGAVAEAVAGCAAPAAVGGAETVG